MFDVGYFPPIEPAASDHSSGVVRVTRLPHRSQENVSEDSARVCKIQRVVMQRFIAAPPHVGFGQAGITVSVISLLLSWLLKWLPATDRRKENGRAG
jgi:hypothetical protein